jgi:hypothetical protein
MMRKTLLLSAIAAGVLGIVAVAYAANTYSVDIAKVTPTKSGTLKHPKAERIQFGYSVGSTDGNRPHVTTDYIIGFGPGIKQNSKLKNGTKFVFAQCKLSAASSNTCPSKTKIGSGIVKNKAGLVSNPSQQIDCQLNLTIFSGDGKLFPPGQNDGKRIKEDVWLGLKGGPPACPLSVNAALPAQFTTYKGGTALKFHVPKTPFQQPQPGLENAVVNVTSSIFKAARVKGHTRGYFESTACPKGGRPINVQYTDTSGAKFTASKKAPCTK